MCLIIRNVRDLQTIIQQFLTTLLPSRYFKRLFPYLHFNVLTCGWAIYCCSEGNELENFEFYPTLK